MRIADHDFKRRLTAPEDAFQIIAQDAAGAALFVLFAMSLVFAPWL